MTDTYIEALERIAGKLLAIYTGLVAMGIIACLNMIMTMFVIYVIIKRGID